MIEGNSITVVVTETMCKYRVAFSRYSEISVESRKIFCPSEFGAPVGITSFEFEFHLWRQKNYRLRRFPCSVVCVMIRLAVLIKHWLVTDRQTDRQTLGHSIYRASIA